MAIIPQVYSVFTFNGETDMLKLHLSILGPHVDRFIILEANKTFSGHQKPLYFYRDQRRFKKWWRQIEYYPMTDWDDQELWQMAQQSPNTQGASHWKREFYIKEKLHDAMRKSRIKDDDLVFIGDVDEIPDPKFFFPEYGYFPHKLKLRVYAYYLNNMSNEEFYGTLKGSYRYIKNECLNHLRSNPSLKRYNNYEGWHFTSQGGYEEVRRKLNDSYTRESYNTAEVQQLLQERHKKGIDYLGRAFTFTQDEENWPTYLKENKDKFKHLLFPQPLS